SADGRHRQAGVAEQAQAVSDVAGTPAELAPHLRHEKRHVQHVNLVRQDVVLEPVAEHEDRVVGHRSADQSLARRAASRWSHGVLESWRLRQGFIANLSLSGCSSKLPSMTARSHVAVAMTPPNA